MDTRLSPYLPWLEWIKTQQERMISLVTAWSQISSYSFDVEGLSEMALALQEQFQPLAKEITTFSLSPQQNVDRQGNLFTQPLGKAISFRKFLDQTPRVFLSGHLDTVFSKERHFPTMRLSPSRLQGPGVADLKGGFVVALIALETLERSPFASSLSWELFCNPDEEVGSTGSYPHLKERAKEHDVAFVFEPALPDGRFVSSRMGSANFALVSRGRAAHVGRNVQEGYNAIIPLLSLAGKLQTLHRPKEGQILSIGRIQGGDAINVVPDLASMHFNLRAVSQVQMDTCMQAIHSYVQESQTKEFPFDLVKLSYRPPKPFSKNQSDLFYQIAERASWLNIPMQETASGGVCDGNFFAEFGLPTLDTMGPIGGGLHTQQEYIELDSLVPRATLMALILMEIASRHLSLGGV